MLRGTWRTRANRTQRMRGTEDAKHETSKTQEHVRLEARRARECIGHKLCRAREQMGHEARWAQTHVRQAFIFGFQMHHGVLDKTENVFILQRKENENRKYHLNLMEMCPSSSE